MKSTNEHKIWKTALEVTSKINSIIANLKDLGYSEEDEYLVNLEQAKANVQDLIYFDK